MMVTLAFNELIKILHKKVRLWKSGYLIHKNLTKYQESYILIRGKTLKFFKERNKTS